MRTSTLSLFLVLCLLSAGHAADRSSPKFNSDREAKIAGISLEQRLSSVPQDIAEALSASGENTDLKEAGCKEYVGKALPINPSKANSVWLVTTPGCGWGAHTGPIWLIDRSPQRNRLIFSGGGMLFDVLEKTHNGYRDIVTSDGAAGYYSDTHYRFDGTKYVKVASRFVDLSSPDACKQHPDIVACEGEH